MAVTMTTYGAKNARLGIATAGKPYYDLLQALRDIGIGREELEALGIRIAIDDFGTGHSSLGYLKRFSIDALKIDRSFITELPDDQEDASIAQAIITLSHALRLKVIAEGVENKAQLDFLATHGCDEMQG